MPAPKGNRFGCDLESFRKPKSYSPQEWVEKFIQYLEHMEDKVWNKKEAIKSGEQTGKIIDIPTSTPLSIRGFCVFANISKQTFLNYESEEGYEDYFDPTTRMRTVIEACQLEGAMVNAYNGSIVSSLVGLTKKNETTLKGLELGKKFDSKYTD